MPCRDDWTPSQEADLYQKSLDGTKKKLDDTTALLCTVLTYASEYKLGWMEELLNRVPELNSWWDRHQEVDRSRLRGEISTELYKLPLDKLREIEKIIGSK